MAVNDVSFALEPGQLLGLLGPNGAGKTTTVSMMAGLTTPTADEARDGVRRGTITVAVLIPAGFGEQSGRAFFAGRDKPQVTMWYDPSHGVELGLVRGVLTEHVMQAVSREMFSGESGRKLVDDTLRDLEATSNCLPISGRDPVNSYAGKQLRRKNMHVRLRSCELRSWEPGDLASLVAHANNRRIWINLRDRFPHPYTNGDGQAFIRASRKMEPETNFAIAVDGAAVGGLGFLLQSDVDRVSAEVGYWLGEPFWGRGITTEALVALTRYAIETHGLTRVFALPFAQNAASCRVLEKAGYILEARLRRSAIKDGVVVDQLQYAFIPD